MAMRFVNVELLMELFTQARFEVMPTTEGEIRAIDVHTRTKDGDCVTHRAYSGGRIESVPTPVMGVLEEEGGKRLDALRIFLLDEISLAEAVGLTPDTLAGMRRALAFLENGS